MWVARIFQGLIVGLILVGLFMLASTIFVIVIGFLIFLGIVQWLRKKGILADKGGKFRYARTKQEYTSDSSNENLIIEAEYKEVEQKPDK